jgi:hypothetical protein
VAVKMQKKKTKGMPLAKAEEGLPKPEQALMLK